MYCIFKILLFLPAPCNHLLVEGRHTGVSDLAALVEADKLATAGSTMWSEHLGPGDAFSTITAC